MENIKMVNGNIHNKIYDKLISKIRESEPSCFPTELVNTYVIMIRIRSRINIKF